MIHKIEVLKQFIKENGTRLTILDTFDYEEMVQVQKELNIEKELGN